VKARLTQENSPQQGAMEQLPVYVGYRTFGNGEIDLRASLRREMVDVAGYRIVEIGEETELAPDLNEFIVLRSMSPAEIDTVKKLIAARLVNWRFYEQITHADGSIYALFVHATKHKTGGDVRFIDLNEM